MGNIKQEKQALRQKYRAWRTQLPSAHKRFLDHKIFHRLIHFGPFVHAQTVYCFVSTPIEINTRRIIQYCWRHGKKVAVPKCLGKAGRMKFYYIRSWDDLAPGEFSLLEPDPETCIEAHHHRNSLCIVPCLAIDVRGYRLGYGKGYYDRFLSKYDETKVAICYYKCLTKKLPHGRFDIPVDFLITEHSLRKIKK